MPVTTTDIANEALDHIGEQQLTDLDTDTTNRGKVCSRQLAIAGRIEQQAFMWPSLQKRGTISGTAHATLDTYYEFTVPADLIQVIDTNRQVFREGDSFLAYGDDDLTILYQYYEADPNNWPAGLQRCTAVRLAALIAPQLTQGTEVADRMYGLLQKVQLEQRRLAARNAQNPIENRRDHIGHHRLSRQGYMFSDSSRLHPGFRIIP